MSRGVRRWGLWSAVVALLALTTPSSGCGSTAPPGGAAGSHGGAGSVGASGAAGASGTSGEAGSGGAGASGTGGASAGDASADAPVTPTDGDGVPGADAACGTTRLDRVAPDLLLLLDKSGSMNLQLDGTACPVGEACVSRWSEVTKAVNQVVKETESSIRWGLKYFANNNSCSVTAGVAVPVGPMNASPIELAINATQPVGRTPTRLAVASAAQYLATLTDPNPKFLLLATDGLPNCAPGGGDLTADDSAATVAAVKMLADSGIPVYVIGIGNEVMGVSNLHEVAVAGGRPRAADPAYYPVDGSANLVAALRAIGAQTTPCTYALPGTPAVPSAVVIKASNAVVPRDATHAEGWDYDATGKSIRLYGTWCAKDQAGTLANVEETSPCPAGGPPG